MALAAATAREAPLLGLRAGAVVVDHRLQFGSGDVADRTATACRSLGLDPVLVVAVTVAGSGGPEAAARTARLAALNEVADEVGATRVLLGHTRDDQAETVLLGLARGSGTRSLAGMPADSGRWLRPLLGLSRDTVRSAAAALGLPVWDDPHNDDRRYARVRVRHDVLPVLERDLGPGVADALARTAGLLADDAAALDEWAADAFAAATCVPPVDGVFDPTNTTTTAGRTADHGDGQVDLDVASVGGLPAAVRRRIYRLAVAATGSHAALTAVHLVATDALVANWHGQGPIRLPAGVTAHRAYGRLTVLREHRPDRPVSSG